MERGSESSSRLQRGFIEAAGARLGILVVACASKPSSLSKLQQGNDWHLTVQVQASTGSAIAGTVNNSQ